MTAGARRDAGPNTDTEIVILYIAVHSVALSFSGLVSLHQL